MKRIAEVKDKINSKKHELAQVKGQNHDDLKKEHEKLTNEINHAQTLNAELSASNKKIEEDLLKKSKENT